jgi:catechol 2,3-dioxygenase-like lactoylglutathione lyase family enzyme
MEGNHVHVFVRDLAGALAWFARVWAVEPTHREERMAVLPFGPILLLLDQDEEETVTTIGYATGDCDARLPNSGWSGRRSDRGAGGSELGGAGGVSQGTRPHHPGAGTGAVESQHG